MVSGLELGQQQILNGDLTYRRRRVNSQDRGGLRPIHKDCRRLDLPNNSMAAPPSHLRALSVA
jgi:hypothetical protein